MYRYAIAVIAVLCLCAPAWAVPAGTQNLTTSETFVASCRGVLDSNGYALGIVDSVKVTTIFQDGTVSGVDGVWYHPGDAQADTVNGTFMFFDAWSDMDATDGIGQYSVTLEFYDKGEELYASQEWIVNAVGTSVDDMGDSLNALEAWVAQESSLYDPASDSVIVDGSELAACNSAITSTTLATGAIAAIDIAADAITEAKIADNAIAAEHIAMGAIDANAIAGNALYDTNFAAGCIGASELATDAIGAAELADDAIDYATFAATAPTAWWNEGKTGYGLTTAERAAIEDSVHGNFEDYMAAGFSTHSALDVWNVAFATGFSAGSMGDSLNNDSYVQGAASGLTAHGIWSFQIDTMSTNGTPGKYLDTTITSVAAGSSNWSNAQRDSVLDAIQDGASGKNNFKATVSALALEASLFDPASDKVTVADTTAADISTLVNTGVNAYQISGDGTAADNLEAMLDGTGGVDLDLKNLHVRSTGNDTAVIFHGAGAGPGLWVAGGTGSNHGGEFVGYASSAAGLACYGSATGNGSGFYAVGGGTNAPGMQLAGLGSGAGLKATGGLTGAGGEFAGGGTSGHGIVTQAQNGNSSGWYTLGNGTGHGLTTVGGNSSGMGMYAVGGTGGNGARWVGNGSGTFGLRVEGGTNGHAASFVGNGTGEGISSYGGTTGHGIEAVGGATSGAGLYARAAGDGEGIAAYTADGIGFYAVSDSGDGAKAASFGGNGNGLYAVGNQAGSGVRASGGSSGDGVAAESAGSGEGFDIDSGATVNGFAFTDSIAQVQANVLTAQDSLDAMATNIYNSMVYNQALPTGVDSILALYYPLDASSNKDSAVFITYPGASRVGAWQFLHKYGTDSTVVDTLWVR